MNDAQFVIVLAAVVVGFAALCLVVYVFTLVHAARRGRWVWFVLTLLLWPVVFFYWIAQAVRGDGPPPSGGYP